MKVVYSSWSVISKVVHFSQYLEYYRWTRVYSILYEAAGYTSPETHNNATCFILRCDPGSVCTINKCNKYSNVMLWDDKLKSHNGILAGIAYLNKFTD